MKFIKNNFSSILFFIILFISIALSFKLLPDSNNQWLENNAPAWIQAIGSIAAIIASALIARNQYQADRRLELERQAASDIQKFMVIKALMARAHGLSKDICVAFDTKKDSDFETVTTPLMVDTHHALMSLPTFEIPHGLLALDVLTIGRALLSLSEYWSEFCDEVTEHQTIDTPTSHILINLASETNHIATEALKICEHEISIREKITATISGWGEKKANK